MMIYYMSNKRLDIMQMDIIIHLLTHISANNLIG